MRTLTKSQSNPELFSVLASQPEEEELTVKSSSGESSEKRIQRRESVGGLSEGGSLSVMSTVSFGTIEIQEYPMVLGDNPSTSSGPSVELDWEAMSKFTIDNLDKWESQKPPSRKLNQLAMPPDMRTKLLVESGHSMREIREIIKQRDSLRRGKTTIKLPKSIKKIFAK